MSRSIRLIRHRPGAPALCLGLGPGLRPVGAIAQLQQLFQRDTSWAQGRSLWRLRCMLWGSEAAVSAWQGNRLVGFGRATSDGVYRAVLWDVVVAQAHKRRGLGRQLVEGLLSAPGVASAERVYLMTTHGQGFYDRLGFREMASQRLMLREGSG